MHATLRNQSKLYAVFILTTPERFAYVLRVTAANTPEQTLGPVLNMLYSLQAQVNPNKPPESHLDAVNRFYMGQEESLNHQVALIARLLELGYTLLNSESEIYRAEHLNPKAAMCLKALHDYYPPNTGGTEDTTHCS